jgi:uncharacterized damage-inducible protein DinB
MSRKARKQSKAQATIEASLQAALEQSEQFLRFLEQAEEREALNKHSHSPASSKPVENDR